VPQALIDQVIKEIFTQYDKDHNGSLSKAETKSFIKDTLVKMDHAGDFSEADFEAFFASYDDDGDKKITRVELKDFVEMFLAQQAAAAKEENQPV
jgi:Ca2+-binding EF-hand superfamily protein